MTSDTAELEKVHIDLPNHWATGGESLWALPLGGNRYEIRNVPFYAYGLNFGDVVEATSDRSDLKPEVRRVVARSGHQTLRVSFKKTVPEELRIELMQQLGALKASFERATKSYFAIDVEPDGDYQATRKQLDSWQEQGVLDYETCEPRVEDSFDDARGEAQLDG